MEDVLLCYSEIKNNINFSYAFFERLNLWVVDGWGSLDMIVRHLMTGKYSERVVGTGFVVQRNE